MNNGEFWELSHVADGELHSELMRLLANGSRTEARILAHLAAVEERRLHLAAGSSSLFDYCCKRLSLSENEAFHRITAARLARRFPAIFGLVERRALHLTAVCLLRDYLTPNNHQELLAEAAGKTKLQVQELLARRFPRPDVASTIRKLPASREVPVSRDVPVSRALAMTEETTSSRSETAQATRPAPSSTTETTSGPPRAPLSSPAPAPAPAPAPMPTPTPARHAVIEPLSAARYRIQLNASPQLKAKLEQARDLLSHANPSGDLAAVIERALDLLLERTLKRRFAQTKRPRPSRSASRKGGENAEGNPEGVHENTPPQAAPEARGERRIGRRHIANATKREIATRVGRRCTFVGNDGRRCGATQFTQIHHHEPWARHGDDSLTNLRLLCASHNRLLAERDFGREFVAHRIRDRRVSPGAAQPGPPDAERPSLSAAHWIRQMTSCPPPPLARAAEQLPHGRQMRGERPCRA